MTHYQSNNFQIAVEYKHDKTFVNHRVVHDVVNTKDLPKTMQILRATIPTIFDNQCFNYAKQSFAKEVAKTETGHLLEHLILEFLKLEIEKEYGYADFSGITRWDWSKNPRGTFEIEINSKRHQAANFSRALSKALCVLEEIYS